MNQFLKQLSVFWAHIFIIFAGLYGLPHTVWSSSTIMQGAEPPFSVAWLGWAFSGLLMGMTIDVGLIVISIQIARGDGTKSSLVAFALLCAAVFYFQWYYAVAHTAIAVLSLGMVAIASPLVINMQDVGVWIASLCVPIVTMIYTLKRHKHKSPVETVTITQERTRTTAKVERPERPRIAPADVPMLEANVYTATCPDCDYVASKTTQHGANAAVRFHRRAKHKTEVQQ